MTVRTLSRNSVRLVGLLAVAAVLAGAAWYVLASGPTRKVTAHFTSAVGIYKGSDVRMLGIKIGTITKVTTTARAVDVEMSYAAKYRLPADTTAVIVPPSIVSDRYVQLSVYQGGPTLPNPGDIPVSRTIVPVELDDIYRALNDLSTALGPNGAGKNGALSDLVKVAAANLKGNGASLGQSVADLSRAARTLANGRGDLFATVRNLQKFTAALARSDAQVRHFNDQLAQVAGDLADERQSLGAALHNLTVALSTVSNFIKDNQASIHSDVTGLVSLTDILVKEKAALDETLSVAPVAVSNLGHTYNPASGTLDNRSNLDSLADPQSICGLLLANNALTGSLLTTCTQLAKQLGKPLQDFLKLVQGSVGTALDGLPSIPGLPPAAANPPAGPPGLPGIPGVTS